MSIKKSPKSAKTSRKVASPWPFYAVIGGLAMTSIVRATMHAVTGSESPFILTYGYYGLGLAMLAANLLFIVGVVVMGYRFIRVFLIRK